MGRERTASARAPVGDARISAWLYDAAGDDRRLDPSELAAVDPADDRLVWVDVTGPPSALDGVLDPASEAGALLAAPFARPRLDDVSDAFVVRVHMPPEGDAPPPALRCLVRRGLVATQHDAPVDELAEFADRLHHGTEGRLGALDGPNFLAALLEWHLNAWFRAIEDEEQRIDRLEAGILAGSVDDVLADLARLRRRAAALRRCLVPHREVYASLASPDFDVLADAEAAAAFGLLHERVTHAVEAVENLREMVIGTFEITMAQTAQRTNDVMRVLTVASVALLPASLLVGILGMNFHPGFFDLAWLFWVALAAVAGIAGCALWLAGRRGWL